ncbi:S24 family peptidase [Novosphingobium sp. Chol11]|uniref:S24 family peptidase n=1 Tax=Novosphingobium sp. Chol11 TaxID=1385763 RepID=UPI000BE3E693|nr:S24 family peptidase [Novosphingobium sp. Chol11]
MDNVRRKLQELITQRGDTYAGISSLLGRNSAYIHQFITRGTPRKLSDEDRRILSHHFSVPEECLGAQDLPPRPAAAGKPLVTVPILQTLAAAGDPQNSRPNDERKSSVTFDADCLKKLGVKADRISIVRIEGDSMSPTLCDGDDVMIDHDDGSARLRDGVYILRIDDGLVAKRVSPGPLRGQVVVSCDNPAYPTWSGIDAGSLLVLGRVIWLGRQLPRRQ